MSSQPQMPRGRQDNFTSGRRLVAYWTCRFRIRAVDGMAVHGSESGLEIGSVVEPNLRVILNAATGYPYIPGSSVKGKLRSTMEKILGRYDANTGEPCRCGNSDCPVCVLFGAAKAAKNYPLPSSPTRIVVRDAQLTPECEQSWARRELEGPVLEYKTESQSNRATGAAKNPRTGERVPPGTEFAGELVIREFDGDDSRKLLDNIEKVMQVIEQSDGIGSGISRGSGRVAFEAFERQRKEVPSLS